MSVHHLLEFNIGMAFIKAGNSLSRFSRHPSEVSKCDMLLGSSSADLFCRSGVDPVCDQAWVLDLLVAHRCTTSKQDQGCYNKYTQHRVKPNTHFSFLPYSLLPLL